MNPTSSKGPYPQGIRSLCGEYECGLCGTAKGFCCPVTCGADRCITDSCRRPASLATGLIDDFNQSAREQVEWERQQANARRETKDEM